MSYEEIGKRRDIEYTLDDTNKRELESIARPMFGKDDVKSTYVPKNTVNFLFLINLIEYSSFDDGE